MGCTRDGLGECGAVHPKRRDRIALRLAAIGACAAGLALAAPPASAAPDCLSGRAGADALSKPTAVTSWRAGLVGGTRLWRRVPDRGDESIGLIAPRQVSWLLVLRAARDSRGRCWLRVRLPTRPNNAAAWVRFSRVAVRPTAWRLVVSRRARTLSVYRAGDRVRRFRIVIGAPSTPTPGGLFSIVGVWPWNPADFLGTYILPITAHSPVLQEFGGGDGRVGIHGRGGSSLLDPLGAARSHGCIRLANGAISWIVRSIGAARLPGIPLRVR